MRLLITSADRNYKSSGAIKYRKHNLGSDRSLIHMAHACPMIISEDTGAGDLIELLQLEAADLADLAFLDLDLAIVANYYYHLE
jgi:hypothetical protein